MRRRSLGHFPAKWDPVRRKEKCSLQRIPGDGPGSRNDASSHFLTVGTGGGNSAGRGFQGLYIGSVGLGSPCHLRDRPASRNDPAGTEVPLKPNPGPSVICGYVQPGRSRMSNQNQNPGQQNQNPGQKPGQQQGGGQKPGQQQQDPNRQGQNPKGDR